MRVLHCRHTLQQGALQASVRVSWAIANLTNSALVDPLKFYSTYPTERTRALQLGRQTSECEQEFSSSTHCGKIPKNVQKFKNFILGFGKIYINVLKLTQKGT